MPAWDAAAPSATTKQNPLPKLRPNQPSFPPPGHLAVEHAKHLAPSATTKQSPLPKKMPKQPSFPPPAAQLESEYAKHTEYTRYVVAMALGRILQPPPQPQQETQDVQQPQYSLITPYEAEETQESPPKPQEGAQEMQQPQQDTHDVQQPQHLLSTPLEQLQPQHSLLTEPPSTMEVDLQFSPIDKPLSPFDVPLSPFDGLLSPFDVPTSSHEETQELSAEPDASTDPYLVVSERTPTSPADDEEEWLHE